MQVKVGRLLHIALHPLVCGAAFCRFFHHIRFISLLFSFGFLAFVGWNRSAPTLARQLPTLITTLLSILSSIFRIIYLYGMAAMFFYFLFFKKWQVHPVQSGRSLVGTISFILFESSSSSSPNEVVIYHKTEVSCYPSFGGWLASRYCKQPRATRQVFLFLFFYPIK